MLVALLSTILLTIFRLKILCQERSLEVKIIFQLVQMFQNTSLEFVILCNLICISICICFLIRIFYIFCNLVYFYSLFLFLDLFFLVFVFVFLIIFFSWCKCLSRVALACNLSPEWHFTIYRRTSQSFPSYTFWIHFFFKI